MDRRELLYFVTVVEQGALSRAAQRLEISQPTLSHCMAVLEQRHGTKLLLRSSVGVRPTAAGTVLYRHARTILAQMVALDAELAGDGEQLTGEVAVGLPSTVAEVVGADFVTAVQLKHPRVRLTLFESFSGYIEELLVNGRLDLAVLFRRAELPGVTSRSLFTERLHVFGMGSSSAPCSLRELDGVPLILPASGSGVRYLVERAFAEARLNLNVVGNVDSLRAMMKLVAAKRGVTIGSAAIRLAIHPHFGGRRIIKPTLEQLLCIGHPSRVARTTLTTEVESILRETIHSNRRAWNLG